MALEVSGTIKPINNNTFPVVESADVGVSNSQKLSDVVMKLYTNASVVPSIVISRDDYDVLSSSGQVLADTLYLIYEP